MLQSLLELDAYIVGLRNLQLLLGCSLTSLHLSHGASTLQGLLQHGGLVLLFLHLHRLLVTDALGLVHLTFQAGTSHISDRGDAAGFLDKVAQALVLLGERVVAFKLHLAFHADVLLHLVARALAHKHLVEGLQVETWLTVDDKAILQGKGERLTQDRVGLGGLGVEDTS